MSTSDTDSLKTGMKYLAASILIAEAAAVYGLFSHGVYSYFMTYAFMVPLLGGAMPYLMKAQRGAEKHKAGNKKRSVADRITGAGDAQAALIATLTAGSLLKCALDIYGTTNGLLIVYPAAAAVIMAAAAAAAAVRNHRGTQISGTVSEEP